MSKEKCSDGPDTYEQERTIQGCESQGSLGCGNPEMVEFRILKGVSLTAVPGNMMEKIHLECISKHMKDKKVIRSSQNVFMEKKLCLTSLSEVTGLIGKGREVHVIYLNFSKALDKLSPNILIDKLTKYGLFK